MCGQLAIPASLSSPLPISGFTLKKIFQRLRSASRSKADSAPQNSQIPPTKPAAVPSFEKLGLQADICRAVAEGGYHQPTPIQAKSIPALLQGRDLLGCAQTGTGKTASFALPLLQRLGRAQREPGRDSKRKVVPLRALILAPTRELAIQVKESFETYGTHMGVRTGVILGGVSEEPQKKMLRRGLDVLVATPGRFLDLKQQGYIDCNSVETLVLDEADRMLDMGFLNDVRKIIQALPRERQNVLFSATMPREIEELSMKILRDPVKVTVAPVSSTNKKIDQSVYFVTQSGKKKLLLHLLQSEEMPMTLVFMRTKSTANRVSRFLSEAGITAEAIHGNKSQNARQRALENFRSGQTRVLVASDLAARGIDIDNISHVVNYDLPNVFETYVHRIGRTGRASATGTAFSFCSPDEVPYLRGIERLIREKISVVEGHPFAVDPKNVTTPTPPGSKRPGTGSRQGTPRRRPDGAGKPSRSLNKRRGNPASRPSEGNPKRQSHSGRQRRG